MKINLNLEKLQQISSEMQLSKCEVYTGKALKNIEVIKDETTGPFRRKLTSIAFLVNASKAAYAELVEAAHNRKMLATALEIPEEKVAGDINDFLTSDESIVAVASDLRYSSVLENKNLSDIEVILGDASFTALKDLSRLSSLRYVAGNIQVNHSAEEVMQFLPNLEYVGGSIVDLSGQSLFEKQGAKKFVK